MMRITESRAMAAATALCCCIAGFESLVARAAEEIAAASDPKAVAVTFAKALEGGDGDAVVGVAIDGEQNAPAIRSVVRVNVALQALRKAAVDRFGEPGAAVAGGFDPHDTLADRVAASAAQVKGDRAEIPAKGGYPIVLRKIDGRWRVDMAKMLSAAGSAPTLARVSTELADEIKAGKYASPQAALDAMGAKLVKAGPDAVGVGEGEQRKAARAAAKEFVKDLFNGDAKAAKEISIVAAPEGKAVGALAATCDSYRKMGDAAVARFGERGKVFAPEASAMSKEVGEGVVIIEGDSGGIVGMEPRLRLKRVGGVWKVDLVASNRKGELTKMGASIEPMRSVYDQMARDIKAGKYQSADEAMTAMRDKLKAVPTK